MPTVTELVGVLGRLRAWCVGAIFVCLRGADKAGCARLRCRYIGLLEVFEGFGKELVDLAVEVVGVFAQGAVARVWDHPEVGVANILVDKDGVGNGNEVVVATDDERRGLDGVELGESDVGLLPV